MPIHNSVIIKANEKGRDLMRPIPLRLALFFTGAWLAVAGIWAQEGQITIPGRDAWLPERFDNVHFRETSGEGSIITLTGKERSVGFGVDMLLHFNGARQQDETANYQIVRQPLYSDKNALFGGTSGFFQGRGGLVLRPGLNTFLGYGISDHDFSFNFWFYPFFVENGEVLFEWEGQLKLNGEVIPQRISAVFRANRVVWQFRNVFLAPGWQQSLYEVRSDPYIPENWYHQQLVYNEENAMLEILGGSQSQAITYTTADGTAG
ncbi:MAG: hypothetical protein AAF975_07260, partial [Spirochaetota bacterium]